MDPMARRILHTRPLTDSEPEVRAHATPPYLEVMHPLKPLRIPDFGPDLRTGQLWGNARADVVEEFLLDIVINHPVTPLGWTHAEAPPAHIVTSVTHDWPKARAHIYCLRAEAERKYLFNIFYDPESLDSYRRHWCIAKYSDLTMFLDKHFIPVHVPMDDPICQLYCEDLFPIGAFPVTVIHNPVTMRCAAVFANIARGSLPDKSVKLRPRTLLDDPEHLLGELIVMVEELSSSPVPDKVIQRMLGLLVPAELHGDEKGSHALQAAIRTQADTEQRAINAIREKGDAGLDEEAQRLNGIDKWPRRPDPDGKEVPMDAFPTDTGIVVMTALDEAMHYAQVTGRYVLVTVHSDNSSQASRTLNHRLWYNEPLQFTISTKYVLVRLDADMEPMAKLVLNTPVTSSEPDEQAHAATPYLEVMHPLETLRIPVFGTDPKTGVMWGDALPHIVEAFLLDLVIKHPVAALGWTPADAPPPRTDAGGDGTGALAAMDDASGVTGIAGHASDDAAWDLIE